MEIHSEAFGFNQSLYIEVSTFEYQNKDHYDENNMGKAKIDFHSLRMHLPHLIILLLIKNDIIYDTTDGCNIQYTCENEM